MDIYSISYLGYESPSWKEMAEYGPAVFGFGLDESRDDGVYLTMDELDYRIGVHPGDRDRLAYIGVELKDKFAWEEAVETLRANDIEVVLGDEELEARRGCYGVAQFRDPDGWPIELAYGRRWSGLGWQPGRPHRGFRSLEYGVGHTVLASADIERTERFCRDVMGYKFLFQGLAKGGGSFWRFKRTDLSHNIAYTYRPDHVYGDTGSPVPHVGIYCKTIDDVGISWDIVETLYPERIVMSLGRHMQDPVISFYSRTPAGFVVECIWAETLDTVDEDHIERSASRLSLWGHRSPGTPTI